MNQSPATIRVTSDLSEQHSVGGRISPDGTLPHIYARRGEFFEYLHPLSGWDIPVWIRFTADRSVIDVGGLVGDFVVDISLHTYPSLLAALAAMMRYSA